MAGVKLLKNFHKESVQSNFAENFTTTIMKQPELGKKISELRKAKGLTQEELVEKCNIWSKDYSTNRGW